MKLLRWVLTILVCIALLEPAFVYAAAGTQGAPRIINLFLGWQLKESDLVSLSRWDTVVLDVNQQDRVPQYLRRLRELNPNIKLFAYIASEEIADARFSEPSSLPMGDLARRVDDAWYLRDPAGNNAIFWPGTRMLNVTNSAKLGTSGERWNQFLPRFIHERVVATGLWDGVFLDNAFVGISYFIKGPIDLDGDGRAENTDEANRAWQAGMRTLIGSIHARDPKLLLIGNGGTAYADILNGVFFENFPSWSWNANQQEFRDALAKNLAPRFTALNTNTSDQDRPTDYQKMRYGLASALIGDGAYSFDRGVSGHDSLWWYDEYQASIGAAKTAPHLVANTKKGTGSVWTRGYEHGFAVVNSTDIAQHIDLPSVYEKIHGTQDTRINSGQLVRSIDLAPQDGLVLLGQSQATDIVEASFVNGSFVRAFDIRGTPVQNGFFAQRDDAPNGATVISTDLDRDGLPDLASVSGGTVTVTFSNGSKPLVLRPFGTLPTIRLSLAVGLVNHDTTPALIIAKNGGGAADIRTYDNRGRQLAAWQAYAPNFLGGARIAIGDVDGDGKREIITGAGPGGGPHIRLWKTDGKTWGGSFFAFDPKDVGGVSVAVGDVQADGKQEIIVGSGQGALPRVRVFDFRGTLLSEIKLGSVPLAQGLTVSAADINGDGKAEILVGGLPNF